MLQFLVPSTLYCAWYSVAAPASLFQTMVALVLLTLLLITIEGADTTGLGVATGGGSVGVSSGGGSVGVSSGIGQQGGGSVGVSPGGGVGVGVGVGVAVGVFVGVGLGVDVGSLGQSVVAVVVDQELHVLL